ncbi:MAG: hypothetical protein KDD37_03775 [Bdellovibrionales bacterium]|nr:hypothetical protein [Bdellovibrionales bacterium]
MTHIDPSEKGGYNALIFAMAFTVLFMIYIAFLHPGVNIDRKAIEEKANQAAQPAAPAASTEGK